MKICQFPRRAFCFWLVALSVAPHLPVGLGFEGIGPCSGMVQKTLKCTSDSDSCTVSVGEIGHCSGVIIEGVNVDVCDTSPNSSDNCQTLTTTEPCGNKFTCVFAVKNGRPSCAKGTQLLPSVHYKVHTPNVVCIDPSPGTP
jgi:hypothetical protein